MTDSFINPDGLYTLHTVMLCDIQPTDEFDSRKIPCTMVAASRCPIQALVGAQSFITDGHIWEPVKGEFIISLTQALPDIHEQQLEGNNLQFVCTHEAENYIDANTLATEEVNWTHAVRSPGSVTYHMVGTDDVFSGI